MYDANSKKSNFESVHLEDAIPEVLLKSLSKSSTSLFQNLGGQYLHFDRLVENPGTASYLRSFLQCMTGGKWIDNLFDYFNDDLCLILGMSLFRRVSGLSTSVPYHQDANFTGMGCEIVNSWFPLSDCGVTQPGLEVIKCGPLNFLHSEDVKRNGFDSSITKNHYSTHYIGDDLKAILHECDVTQYSLLGPHVKAGDVICFNQYALHRTQPLDMASNRMNLEIRVTSLRALLKSNKLTDSPFQMCWVLAKSPKGLDIYDFQKK